MGGLDGPRYTLGCDLGQAKDPTALVVLEAVPVPTGAQEVDYAAPYPVRDMATGARIGPLKATQAAHYHGRYVERLRLGMPYPDQVDHVAALLARPPLAGACELVLDATGVGRAITDMFTAAGLEHCAVTITAGHAVHQESASAWMVPKKDLVATVQRLLQERRLGIAAELPEADTLIKELLGFRLKVTAAANVIYEAATSWRDAPHDDLVLATALAAWRAETRPGGWAFY